MNLNRSKRTGKIKRLERVGKRFKVNTSFRVKLFKKPYRKKTMVKECKNCQTNQSERERKEQLAQ
jgi:hypothetical protein